MSNPMEPAYYREIETGDYLCVFAYNNRLSQYECRAVGLTGNIGSVCTVGASFEYIEQKCRMLDTSEIPANWLRAIQP